MGKPLYLVSYAFTLLCPNKLLCLLLTSFLELGEIRIQALGGHAVKVRGDGTLYLGDPRGNLLELLLQDLALGVALGLEVFKIEPTEYKWCTF